MSWNGDFRAVFSLNDCMPAALADNREAVRP
jgi:hypothetical protein